MAKTAVITGATKGLGKQIALELAKDGFEIVINYRTENDSLAQMVEEINKTTKAYTFKADISNFDEAKALIDFAASETGKIDLLVNNAGITNDKLLVRMSEEDFSKVIDINLKGTFNCIRHASRLMMKQKFGRIVNISSVIGLIGNVGQANYAASKAGVIGLTKSAAREMAPYSVTVNAIAPGFIKSDMTDKLTDEIKDNIKSSIPMRKIGEPKDVANLVKFLANDETGYITGQVINVDGGMVMYYSIIWEARMQKRVVITGMGTINPVGNNLNDYWNALLEGKCGIDIIKAFDPSDFKAKTAGEVKDFNPSELIGRKEAKRLDRFSQFAIVAAKEALAHSKLDMDKIDKNRAGAVIGSGIGGLATIEAEQTKLLNSGPDRVSPLFIPMAISNMAAGNVAITIGLKGICTSVVTACASATNAIGEAFKLIQSGNQDIVFAGGAEASITPLAIAGFASMTALSTSTDPKRASIPFDKDRDGFVMGEGAGVLVLESLEHAQERGADIYGEIVGYGCSSDAYHITSPEPSGEGGARAMKNALEDANVKPEEVIYINAHGTSTPYNDKIETAAIKRVFGEHSKDMVINSTKSMTGHLLGAAGAVEAIASIMSLKEGIVHPTVGLVTPDEECDLDYVKGEKRVVDVKYAISNSLGFGGHNASLLFKKWEGK